jgi:hypothetical protein
LPSFSTAPATDDAECLATIISRLQNLGDADRPDCLMCEETLADYAAVGAMIMVHVNGGVMPSTLCHRCAGRYDSEITAAILQRLNKEWPGAERLKTTPRRVQANPAGPSS